MLEILKFIFSDLLNFLGTAILLEIVFGGIRARLRKNDDK